jgi:type IV pilus assembly protein PilM
MANLFQNFFENLGIGADKSQSVLGIDIGSSSIKVVQLRKKGARAVLETYGELSLGPYAGVSVGMATNLTQDKIVEALHDLLTEKEVNVTTNLCALAIPFASSLMSVIEMPEVATKDLADMVPIEARKYIPVPITEVSLDWSVIPRSGNGSETADEPAPPQEKSSFAKKALPTIDVLIVAIHNQTIARYTDIVAKNNLKASFFEIEIFSTMRSVIDENIAPVMIFDMGAATTKLFIVERGILKVSHTINRGSQDMTLAISKSFGIPEDKAEVMKRQMGIVDKTSEGVSVARVGTLTLEYIFEEANRIVVEFERKYNKAVSKIIMIGGGSSLKGLNDYAKKGFQTEVVSGEPFSKVVTPAFLEEILRQTGPQFAVSVGLALRRLQEM